MPCQVMLYEGHSARRPYGGSAARPPQNHLSRTHVCRPACPFVLGTSTGNLHRYPPRTPRYCCHDGRQQRSADATAEGRTFSTARLETPVLATSVALKTRVAWRASGPLGCTGPLNYRSTVASTSSLLNDASRAQAFRHGERCHRDAPGRDSRSASRCDAGRAPHAISSKCCAFLNVSRCRGRGPVFLGFTRRPTGPG